MHHVLWRSGLIFILRLQIILAVIMKINPKQMEKMMKQMGMQMSHVNAEEVIIRTADKDIIIREPEVSKVNMMGQQTFQIAGRVEERQRSRFSKEDVDMVVEKTGATREDAEKTLEDIGDLAETILKLKK